MNNIKRRILTGYSDGEARIIGAGEVILVEDTHGKVHLSTAIEGQLLHSIFVPAE